MPDRHEVNQNVEALRSFMAEGGIGILEGEISGLLVEVGGSPVCLLYHQSEMPTEKERDLLRQWAKKIFTKCNPGKNLPGDGEEFKFEGSNTAIFLKQPNGFWRYHRATWTEQLWNREPKDLRGLLAGM